MEYAGWTPTVTGRLSFSVMGGDNGSHRATVCNRTRDANGYIFGVETKRSPDGPLHVAMLPHRIHHAMYLIRLEITPALLPYPGVDSSPELRLDARGSLTGEVIVVVADDKLSPWVFDKIEVFARRTREANRIYVQNDKSIRLRREAESDLISLWQDLVSSFRADTATAPAFARANVSLLRSGETRVTISPDDVFLTEGARVVQLDVNQTARNISDEEMSDAMATSARQIFHFVRDLAHRHYHHNPRADLTTTTYLWSGANDEYWRRETHHTLIRMAIASRRENDCESYKQSLGILSYAESFQRHLGGWKVAGEVTKPSREFFPYDFAELRLSIEASLRTLESRDGKEREGRTFVFATLLTGLGLVLEGGHVWGVHDQVKCLPNLLACKAGGEVFWSGIVLAVRHPWEPLIGFPILALLIGISTRRIMRSSPVLAALRGGIGRFLDALMAEFARKRDTGGAWRRGLVAVAILGICQVMLAILMVWLYFVMRSGGF